MSSRPPFTRPSLLYRLSLGTVAVVMLLLPIVYAGLTLALVYGVHIYLTEFFLSVLGTHGQWNAVSVVMACAPLFIGWVTIIGMIRPVFARRAPEVERVGLDPQSEPGLQALVLAVCRELRIPAPGRVEFSCELNAAASFERLARILQRTLDAHAGYAAHRRPDPARTCRDHRPRTWPLPQRAGMRASFLVRSINHWFARVLAVPSAWDPLLGTHQTGFGGYGLWIWVIVICSQAGTAIAEAILRALMMSGHVVAAALLRQMEFDADRCEVRFAGSAAFVSASDKLATLGAAFHQMLADTGRVWQGRRRLPDDLAELVQRYAERIRAETPPAPATPALAPRTGWLDTHPSMAERVRRARALAEPGSEISDAPAPALFLDFTERSQRVTWTFFGDEHNLPVSRKVVLAAGAWLREAWPEAPAELTPPPLPTESRR